MCEQYWVLERSGDRAGEVYELGLREVLSSVVGVRRFVWRRHGKDCCSSIEGFGWSGRMSEQCWVVGCVEHVAGAGGELWLREKDFGWMFMRHPWAQLNGKVCCLDV